MATPLPLLKKGAESPPKFSAHFYYGQTAGWIKMALRGRPWSRPHCVRWGPSYLPQKGAEPPFLANVYCGQTAGRIKMPLGMEAGLSPGEFVLDGDPAPSLKGHSPQFSANLRCGQTAGCTQMPLGTEVGLGPGDFVLDGHTHPAQFLAHVYCGPTAGWMKTPLGTEVDLGHIVHIVLDGATALRERRTVSPPLFGPSILWPRSPISSTAELLLYSV